MTKDENKKIIFSHKGKFFWKFVVSIILNVLLLIIPIFYSKIIDSLTNLNYQDVYYYIIIFGLLTIFYRFIEYFNQKAYFLLYFALYKSYMSLGLSKTFDNSLYSLSRFSLSEYSNILSEDFEMISDYYSTLVIRLVEIMEFIYIIIYFFFINSIIGFLTLFSSILIIFLLIFFNKSIASINIERKIRNDRRISLFQEIFLSIKAIKGFNILKKLKDRINNIVDDYISWHIKLNMKRFNLKEITLGIVDLFKIISLFIGIKLVIKGSLTLGVITIIYSYYAKLSELIASIILLSESLNNKKVSNERVEKLFQYAKSHEIEKDNNNDINGEIVFKNILYGNKISPYLNEISVKFHKNSLNILVGNSKSCDGIFDLLLCYNSPHQGSITIDNVDINEYSRENISNIIGYIMEYPTFFNTSIRENLLIFDNNFENIVSVCKYLRIHNYILNLPHGYEEILDVNASNIDVDIKYLLAFAREFLRKSKIILIGNILEHVSRSVYKQITNLLFQLKDEHTIIIISKDLQLIKNENISKIILFNHGRIVGNDKYNKLIKENSEYKKMLKKM